MTTDRPAGGGIDLSTVNRNDLGVMIAGAVALLASFLPYYGWSGFISGSVTAWHSYATLGLLLLLAGAVVIAVRTFAAGVLPDTLPWHVIAAAAAGLGTLLVLLRAVTLDSYSGPGLDAGIAWGAWVLILAGIAETVFAVLGMRESGEQIPGRSSGAAPGAAGGDAGAPPPSA